MAISVMARLILIFSAPDFLQQECLVLQVHAVTFTYRVGTSAASQGEATVAAC
jgi:endonuclease/exonuclease/phosphatase (EEP) superfamily protein YafD